MESLCCSQHPSACLLLWLPPFPVSLSPLMIQFQTCYKKQTNTCSLLHWHLNQCSAFGSSDWHGLMQKVRAPADRRGTRVVNQTSLSQLDKLVWLTGSIIRLLSSRAHSPPKKETLQTCSKQMEMWSELIGNNIHFIFNTNHDLPAQIKHHTGLFEISTYQLW